MKDCVVIKSYNKGIALHLNANAAFDEVLEELAYRFLEAKGFFGKSVMALSIEGREVTEDQEAEILDIIHENSDVRISCIVGKNKDTETLFFKAATQMEAMPSEEEKGRFFKGNLTDGEVIETDDSIIIIGDVETGCTVVSAKSIIVLGALRGEAYAGGNGTGDAFVAALEMEPERIKIGDFKYKPTHKRTVFGKKNKVHAQIAVIKENKIVMEPFTKELLSVY